MSEREKSRCAGKKVDNRRVYEFFPELIDLAYIFIFFPYYFPYFPRELREKIVLKGKKIQDNVGYEFFPERLNLVYIFTFFLVFFSLSCLSECAEGKKSFSEGKKVEGRREYELYPREFISNLVL